MGAFQRLRFSAAMRETTTSLLRNIGGLMIAGWRRLAVPQEAHPIG